MPKITTGRGDHEAGGRTPNTTTDTPRPSARAADDQDPDGTRPDDQRRPGTTPSGHGPEGNAKKQRRGAAATADTKRTDRDTKAPAPAPDARKTDADGRTKRTAASAPGAQPTATCTRAGRLDATRRARREATRQPREPEKPTKTDGTLKPPHKRRPGDPRRRGRAHTRTDTGEAAKVGA